MNKNFENELKYIIKGKQLDNSIFEQKGQKIIWRTNKSQVEIELIMKKIQDIIYKSANNFNINKNEISTYTIPIISHKNIDKNRETHNLHSCYYNFTKSTPYTKQEKLTAHNIKTNRINFLTKHFVKNANKKLKHTIKKHLLFCKNNPINIQHNPTISVNANVFLCKNKDWITEYQQSIQPIICGRFYIRPSWHKNNTEYENLIIDPSLSFGSGHHATTAMCISFLDSMELKGKKLLDVGCGSGILSLVAAKLGATIYACDTDNQACMQSIKNFQINNLKYNYIWQGSLQSIEKLELPNEYDCICANIVSSVLLLLQKELIKYLKKGGILILSGILQEHEERIFENFRELTLVEKKQIDEWLCFKFIKK